MGLLSRFIRLIRLIFAPYECPTPGCSKEDPCDECHYWSIVK